MYFISPEPSMVLAYCAYVLISSVFAQWMFNFQDINIKLQKEFIYITLSVFMPKFYQSHDLFSLVRSPNVQTVLESIQTQLPKQICVSIHWHIGLPNRFA